LAGDIGGFAEIKVLAVNASPGFVIKDDIALPSLGRRISLTNVSMFRQQLRQKGDLKIVGFLKSIKIPWPGIEKWLVARNAD